MDSEIGLDVLDSRIRELSKMIEKEMLYRNSTVLRQIPVNINQSDLDLFEHELRREIPATFLLHFQNITVNPDGALIYNKKILPESFPSPHFCKSWIGNRVWLKLLLNNFIKYRNYENLEGEAYWITDIWSQGYFHWMTDTLARLYAIKDKIQNKILLLPGDYSKVEYINSSLEPFSLQDVRFIQNKFHCKNLNIPTHVALTGNYNEEIIRGLRNLYTNHYQVSNIDDSSERIYISRGKTQKRKIINENELINVIEKYGFRTIHFEDHTFEEQVKIALGTRFLISNHGGGLSNILFMRSGSKMIELRKAGDNHNNCFYSLASCLNIDYFYQLCNSPNPDENAHTANLIVECDLLKNNIEKMLES